MIHLFLLLIYIAFISLGLPDALLGSVWPIMSSQFDVSVALLGVISFLVYGATVASSLMADRLNCRFGVGRVAAFSVALTAISLFGFAASNRFWQLCLWSIPYGLGAGSVDAGLNGYVAKHYASRHVNWLHCMWGIGASAGPYVMGIVLSGGQTWNYGYLYIGIAQVVLTAVLLLCIPKWKKTESQEADKREPLSLRQTLKISGVKDVLAVFICYSAVEIIAGQWASSYLSFHLNVGEEMAASFGALFYLGITVGRAVSGFMTLRLRDKQMAYIGMGTVFISAILIFAAKTQTLAVIGFGLCGFGCAPLIPCIIHATPARFGEAPSQAIIGLEMACFYAGTCLFPPMFGLIAEYLGLGMLPIILFVGLALMFLAHQRLYRITEK